MNVVAFTRHPIAAPTWTAEELRQLIALFRAEGNFAVGATEAGDPQFYLLGTEHECVLCVSRLGSTYLLEDGEGRVLGEAPALDRFAAEAARAAVQRGRSFVTRLMLAWITLRLAIEEKLDPMLEEGEELLARFAPQLAALV